jgi:hypothetical protein
MCLVAGCAFAGEEAVGTGPSSASQPARPAAVAKAAAVSPPNVVATLRFRDVDLVISRAQTSPRFTLIDRSGMSLATDLEEADLRKHHPDLYSAYRFGYAHGPFLDARLDLPRENRRSPDGL